MVVSTRHLSVGLPAVSSLERRRGTGQLIELAPLPFSGCAALKIEQVISFRAVVSYLGEQQQAGWWQSAFWAQTADAFMAPVFPRSLFAAKVTGASAAARKLHDERIGIGRVFHLFRLPEDLEQAVHAALHQPEIIQSTTALLASRQSAEEFLESHCNSQHEVDSHGPVLCGEISDFHKKSVTTAIAAAYLNGFRHATKVFPYLTETHTEGPQ